MKISYHEDARKHAAAVKVKRMLRKIAARHSEFRSHCNIKLTGVNEIDRREVKYYFEYHLKDFKEQIHRELLRNEKFIDGKPNKDYEEGYYIKENLQLIEALNDVYDFIWNNYPELEVKKTKELIFKGTTHEEKFEEMCDFIEENLVQGYKIRDFAVLDNGNSKELYSWYSTDLSDAVSFYMTYI